MSENSEEIYIPPFSNVRLIECWNCMSIAPVAASRQFFGYGKIKARDFTIETEDDKTEPFWDDCTEDEEAWAIVQWIQYEDGTVEVGDTVHLRSPTTEDDVRAEVQKMIGFQGLSRQQLLDLSKCFKATDDDRDYIDIRYPNFQAPPFDPKDKHAKDVYEARLLVMEKMLPETVNLIRQVDEATDPQKCQRLRRETVQAYCAELAHFLTEDEIKAWQRTNPIGTEWMRVLIRTKEQPAKKIDRISYELAFNWVRQKYHLMTASELAVAIQKATSKLLKPFTIKKRRDRLGLTTERTTGPRPKSEQ